MESCPICGSECFDPSDGLYFCTDCGTQSQNVREEIAEDDFVDITIHKQLKKGKQTDLSTPVKQQDGVRKVTVENFQRMLQQQADTLVELGYHSSLKEPLKYLWFVYLDWFMEKMSKLFREAPKKVKLRGGRGKRKADGILKNSPKRTKTEQQQETVEESLELEQVSMEGDKEEENLMLDDDGVVNLCAVRRGNHKHLGRFELMPSKKLTIALLYLALQYSGQTVLVVELIRLLERHKLQPIGFEHTGLDNEMDLKPEYVMQYIHPFFQQVIHIPLPAIDYHQLGCIILDKLLQPKSLHIYLRRLLQVYCPTMQTVAPTMHWTDQGTQPDLLMAAMIVVLLKLIYRLDDVFEIQQSSVAVTIDQSSIDESTAVYVWSDWIQLINYHHITEARSGVVDTIQDIAAIEDGYQKDYVLYCEQLMEREALVLPPKHATIIRTIQTTFKDYLSKQTTQTEPKPRTDIPKPRLVPIGLILPDIGRSSSTYLFVSYKPKTKLPLHLIPNLSSSVQFLLKILSRVVGYKLEQLMAALSMIENEVRRRAEIATLTIATLSATTELLNGDKNDLLQRS